MGKSITKRGLIGAAVGIVLVTIGWILAPTTSLLSKTAAYAILVIYGVIGYFVPPALERINPQILKYIALFGLPAGIVFTGEILLEYILLPASNISMGLVEFGTVFFVYFFAGLVAAYRANSTRQALLTAAGSAMLSALIWLVFTLITFYVFRGTAQQEQVFRAECNYDDFARSSMRDFNAFIMEDFMGATFFHLTLGPFLATMLGWLGSIIGKILARLRN